MKKRTIEINVYANNEIRYNFLPILINKILFYRWRFKREDDVFEFSKKLCFYIQTVLEKIPLFWHVLLSISCTRYAKEYYETIVVIKIKSNKDKNSFHTDQIDNERYLYVFCMDYVHSYGQLEQKYFTR